ncbi:hypothetical protein ABEDC_0534 [Acinetobacter lwoffii]|nr:hypothetical protein ABEDC_0534 [Acinetobacter lwoffii]
MTIYYINVLNLIQNGKSHFRTKFAQQNRVNIPLFLTSVLFFIVFTLSCALMKQPHHQKIKNSANIHSYFLFKIALLSLSCLSSDNFQYWQYFSTFKAGTSGL